MSFLFRPHRGSLQAAMAEVKEFENLKELTDHLQNGLDEFWNSLNSKITPETVTITPQGHDTRISWDTHLISLEGYGVFGMCNKDPR